MGSWSRGDAICSLKTRAQFYKAVLLWGGSIRKKSFYLLACVFEGSNIFACD